MEAKFDKLLSTLDDFEQKLTRSQVGKRTAYLSGKIRGMNSTLCFELDQLQHLAREVFRATPVNLYRTLFAQLIFKGYHVTASEHAGPYPWSSLVIHTSRGMVLVEL